MKNTDQMFHHLYVFCIIIAVSLAQPYIGQTLSYHELESLNVTCSPADTCSKLRVLAEDNLVNQNCECKASCLKFNTCCIDAPRQTASRRKTKISWNTDQQAECHHLRETDLNIYARTKCRNWWQGDPMIRNFCENNLPGLEDPLAVLPVTNYLTAVTYKNYFCALCNDDIRHLEFWNISIKWNILSSDPSLAEDAGEDKLVQDLVYDNESSMWRLHKRKSRHSSGSDEGAPMDESTFKEFVTIRFDPSESIKEKITHCDPYLISDCDSRWLDETVRRMCHSYMGMIYIDSNVSGIFTSERFRNIHCAICNFAVGTSRCKKYVFTPYGHPAKPSLSFSLLLDINASGGSQVGVVNRCSGSELYDPFFKKCRSMACVKPGYKVKAGKCQPS